MVTAYESVAGTRPRIRRDLLFTKTPDGVLFHNADGGFSLTAATAYRFASLVVPHLNGQHRVDDICAALGPAHREMVGELVKALYERDFARDVPASAAAPAALDPAVAARFDPQLAYIEHYKDEPARRFLRFRETRVAVLGVDAVARWCALSLVRNGCAAVGLVPELDAADVWAEAAELIAAGCPVRLDVLAGPAGSAGEPAGPALDWAALDDYDVVVVGGAAAAVRLLAAGVPVGKTLLPVWTIGSRAVVGPLTAAGQAGCWTCAALRLGGNGEAAAAAELWRGVSLPALAAAGPRPAGSVAAMLGNLLGYEIFRLTTEALPAETAGKVIIQNMSTLDVLTEPVFPHPSCPNCATLDSADPSIVDGPIELATEPSTVDGDGDPAGAADRAADAAIVDLNERMVLVGRYAGVFTRFTDEPWVQTPLKVSTLELAVGTGRREIAAFDVHHVAGARQRALRAAAGVYAEHVGVPRVPAGSAPAIDPGALGIATGPGIGPGPEGGPGGWLPATSLLDGERWLVPAAAVRPYGPDNRGAGFVRTGAGVGAGSTLAEAARHGLASALAYRAVLGAIRGGAVNRVALDTAGGSPELTFLARSAANLGVELELLELSGVAGGYALLARVADPAGGAPLWRAAAHPQWTDAALAAVRDLLGAVQLGQQTGRSVDSGDPLLRDLDAATLRPTADRPARLAAAGSWAALLAGLRSGGLDALAAVTTSADLRRGGLATTRVLLAERSVR